MNRTEQQAGAPGDVIVVEGHQVGAGRRIGEIVEALDRAGSVRFRVRWDDGHETLFYPHDGDATIRRRTRNPRRRAAIATAEEPYDGAVLVHDP